MITEGITILGAPSFGDVLNMDYSQKEFLVPFGQSKICQAVLKETQDKDVIIEKLATEYLSIVLGLKQMGISFYITYTGDVRISGQAVNDLKTKLGCRFVVLPKNFPPQFGCYPRDMLVFLPTSKIVLMNQEIAGKKMGQQGDYYFVASLYGEGGRVLSQDNTVLVAKELVIKNARIKCDDQLKILRERGVKIGQFPIPISGLCMPDEIQEKVFTNDHLDRVGTLLKDTNGEMHFVVDPKICIMDEIRIDDWDAFGPKESIERITQYCEPLGIKVHYPHKMKIPYAINMEQFPDGRVLMTSGDKSLAKIVERIVGWKNVFKTRIPIRFMPVYNRAGIRCLLNRIPESTIASLTV